MGSLLDVISRVLAKKLFPIYDSIIEFIFIATPFYHSVFLFVFYFIHYNIIVFFLITYASCFSRSPILKHSLNFEGSSSCAVLPIPHFFVAFLIFVLSMQVEPHSGLTEWKPSLSAQFLSFPREKFHHRNSDRKNASHNFHSAYILISRRRSFPRPMLRNRWK